MVGDATRCGMAVRASWSGVSARRGRGCSPARPLPVAAAQQGRRGEEEEEHDIWGLRVSEWREREAAGVFWDIREYIDL